MFYTKHLDDFAKIRIFNPLLSVRFKAATKVKMIICKKDEMRKG